MKYKKAYFLHIPKTSGMKMQYDLLNAAHKCKNEVKPSVYLPGEFEFVFNPATAKNNEIICGHFGRNPIETVKNIFSFSMIREPYEQYLSTLKYAASYTKQPFTEDFLDFFLTEGSEMLSQFEGMSGCENPQSCFLYSKTSYLALQTANYEKVIFVEKPQSIDDVMNKIENIIIGTVKNRNYFINVLNAYLYDLFQIKIDNSIDIVNPTPKMDFKISKKHKNLIMSKTWLDFEIYNILSTKEQKRMLDAR
jgi:hypothetical protein